jgi:hypothetical protein
MNILAVDGVPVPLEEPMRLTCDRCGKVMDDHWEIEGMNGVGGNCSCCNDDLCAECAGGWDDDGECQKCQKTRDSGELF